MIISSVGRMTIVGETALSAKALDIAASQQPHVILLDLEVSVADVLHFMGRLQKAAEQSLILLLSNLSDAELARQALCSGAAGVVFNVQPPAMIITLIECLCREDPRVKPSPIRRLNAPAHDMILSSPPNRGIDNLTTREREIVCLIGQGFRNKAIAERLCIGETTVRHHLSNIFSKLELSDRQQLLIWAHRHRMLEHVMGPGPA